MLRAIMWAGIMLCLAAGQCSADIITQWNFNSVPPDNNTSTGTLVPNSGMGTASLVGGTTATFASGDASGGSSDPATGDDSAWNTTTYPAQGMNNKTAGVQFNVSTVGFQGIAISWDQRHSNTSSRYVQFQYSIDGSSFIDFGGLFEGNAGDSWFNGRSVDLSSISGVNDNPNFAFRIVSAWGPNDVYVASNPDRDYATTGTWRFDMVTVRGAEVPEPATLAIFGVGLVSVVGYGVARRRRVS